MKVGMIYCLICPKTKLPKYVGQTTRALLKRLNEHKYKIDNGFNHRTNWLKLLRDENIIDSLEIVKLGEYDVCDLDDMETHWIDILSSNNIELCNTILKGGFGGYREFNEDKNIKISKSLRGIKRKQFTDEHRRKIGDAQIGNKHNLGRNHTDETKDKIRNSKKGSIPHNIRKIKQLDLDGNYIREWDSSHEAAKFLNISQGNISIVASKDGRRKSTGGFMWEWC
jgi:group I intron endonuclease